jgi:hypothetical protein
MEDLGNALTFTFGQAVRVFFRTLFPLLVLDWSGVSDHWILLGAALLAAPLNTVNALFSPLDWRDPIGDGRPRRLGASLLVGALLSLTETGSGVAAAAPLFDPARYGTVFVVAAATAGTALLIRTPLHARALRAARSTQLRQSAMADSAIRDGWRDAPEIRPSSFIPDSALRAARYRRARGEAAAEVKRYLPPNPRTAKRMMNHLSLARAIAEERGVFTDGTVTHQHLGKWVGISEQWPQFAAALSVTPSRIYALEAAESVAELQELVDALAPGTPDVAALYERLGDHLPLASVLDRLVRYEGAPAGTGPATAAPDTAATDTAAAPVVPGQSAGAPTS